MLPDYMRIKEFCTTTGIPESVIRRALKSEYANQIGRKAKPDGVTSPYLVKTAMAIKLWEGGYIG